jgi:hypothetical protein
MTLTAKEVRECMKEETWLRSLCLAQFPFLSQMATPPQSRHYPEVTVRIPTEEKTRFGKDKPQRRRFDVVILVKPYYRAWGEEIFTIGVEIKVSKSDLMNDAKISDYLGYTDYFFLCVPEDLLAMAVIKRDSHPDIGILRVTGHGCQLVVMPGKQQIEPVHGLQLYRELTLKTL